MAYSKKLAEKIRGALAHLTNVQEKKMFGGLAFMVNDKMCITVGADRMMCRVEPALHEELVGATGCRTVVMRGREYKGYVYINEDALQNEDVFNRWIKLALDYNVKAKSSKK